MPAWPLKVEGDEPGRKLILSTQVPSVSKGLLAGIGAFIVLMVAAPTLGMAISALVEKGVSQHTLIGLALGAFYPMVTAVGLVVMAGRLRTVSRFAVDGTFGRIEIQEFRILGGGGGPEIIRTDDLRSMSVRATASFRGGTRNLPGGARARGRNLALTVKLRFHAALRRPPRELKLEVEGVDRIEEGSDLALRLAGAAGFDQHRVVSSDPRAVEMEFSVGSASGSAPVAESLPKADYGHDKVSDEAREIAAHEAIAPFDPASFDSECRLETWEPGREVKFHKPTGIAAVGCSPVILLLLTGPVVFVAATVTSSGKTMPPLADRIVGAVIFGLFGLILGGLALLVVWGSAATTVVFDWTERRLRSKHFLSRTDHAFSELRAIELRCIKARTKNSVFYYCRLVAQLTKPGEASDAQDTVDIVSTRSSPEADTSYQKALPLATELARALGVPRVVTEEFH